MPLHGICVPARHPGRQIDAEQSTPLPSISLRGVCRRAWRTTPACHGKLMGWECSIFLSYLEQTYALLPCSACPAGLGAASTVPRGHQVRLFLVYNFHTLCSPRLRSLSVGMPHTPKPLYSHPVVMSKIAPRPLTQAWGTGSLSHVQCVAH